MYDLIAPCARSWSVSRGHDCCGDNRCQLLFGWVLLQTQVVKILNGKYPPVPTRYTSNLRNLVDSMLKQNPRVSITLTAESLVILVYAELHF